MHNIYDKAYKMALVKASKAELTGHLTINGNLYTFAFDQREWHYSVYENGFLLFNVKEFSLAKAKKYLKWYLAN